MKSLMTLPEWKALQVHQAETQNISVRDLFKADPNRTNTFQLNEVGLFFDYSKNRIDKKTISLLVELANACQLSEKIDELFSGDIVNESEHLPAWHTALRELNHLQPEVRAVLEKMQELVARIQAGKYLGFSGKPIQQVVNVGIGGSHLGPLLAYQALKEEQPEIRCHFISNLDESTFLDVVGHLDPETTLFIISSKSFTTYETIENFHRLKRWMLESKKDESAIKGQFIAVTANVEKAKAEGFSSETIFPFWSWVGGRFSVWSAIGLPIAIALGWEKFHEFLTGAFEMDQHFRKAEFSKNMPILLAMIAIWYNNFYGFHTQAIIPYSQRLQSFPRYLQQLHMESQGKSCQQNGEPVNYATGSIIFGGVGMDTQHSFHQFFLQGTTSVPIDFILPLKSSTQQYQLELIANCLGQSRMLMEGSQSTEPYKILYGNNPSNLIMMDELSPRHLGALMALYEHKVYVQSVIWNIDAFDQWAVEQGKKAALDILSALKNKTSMFIFDPSTEALIQKIKDRQ